MYLWHASMTSTKVLTNMTPRPVRGWNRPQYMAWDKLPGKLLLALKLGELELKANRRNESIKQYGGFHCWVGWCCGDDDINHVMVCEGYDTKPPRDDKGDEKIVADYLIELNSERIRRWGCPLIYIRGF